MRILHVISSLEIGGAESMLMKLLLSTRDGPHDFRVVALKSPAPLAAKLREAGIEVDELGAHGRLLWPRHWLRLRKLLLEYSPQLIHSWMYHANVAAQLVRMTVSGRIPLITSVRGALHAPSANRLATQVVLRVDALLSSKADAIVFNSGMSARQHVRRGYCADRVVRIDNGFDTEVFCPSMEARVRMRRLLGIGASERLVGAVGRFHEIKGQDLLLRAAPRLLQKNSNIRLVLVGKGCTADNPRLREYCEQPELSGRVILLGERGDLPEIYCALDLLINPSRSESFPNVVGEAMACGVPCVVTDVGDCAEVVGDTGLAIPPNDEVAIAEAVITLLSMPDDERSRLGLSARERIREKYSLAAIASQFSKLYAELSARRHAAKRNSDRCAESSDI